MVHPEHGESRLKILLQQGFGLVVAPQGAEIDRNLLARLDHVRMIGIEQARSHGETGAQIALGLTIVLSNPVHHAQLHKSGRHDRAGRPSRSRVR